MNDTAYNVLVRSFMHDVEIGEHESWFVMVAGILDWLDGIQPSVIPPNNIIGALHNARALPREEAESAVLKELAGMTIDKAVLMLRLLQTARMVIRVDTRERGEKSDDIIL